MFVATRLIVFFYIVWNYYCICVSRSLEVMAALSNVMHCLYANVIVFSPFRFPLLFLFLSLLCYLSLLTILSLSLSSLSSPPLFRLPRTCSVCFGGEADNTQINSGHFVM